MMQKVRNRALPLRAIALSLLVDTRFQVLWTPLTGVLFTFPSRYSFTIGRQVVFRLQTWSSHIQAGVHVSRLTWGFRSALEDFAYGALTLYGPPFQTARLSSQVLNAAPQPRRSSLRRFGLFRFRSPLLAESLLFSFPPGTEMFHFPGFAPLDLFVQSRVRQHYLPW